MKQVRNLFLFTIIIFSFFSRESLTFAQSSNLSPKIILPGEIKWKADSKPSTELQTIVLAGNPEKQELYTSQIKIPANLKLMPHRHPENRCVIVISGTLFYCYGETFDESKLKAMPPGTFFTEPANQPHFAWAKEGDVVVQVTGVGPTGASFLQKSDGQEK